MEYVCMYLWYGVEGIMLGCGGRAWGRVYIVWYWGIGTVYVVWWWDMCIFGVGVYMCRIEDYKVSSSISLPLILQIGLSLTCWLG